MVAGSTTADDSGAPFPGSRTRPPAVRDLEGLLALLFPDPPSLDCVTVDDILRLFRFTGLDVPALRAIEQSQRIVRARGDYAQLGVCEFHIGLIYFTWADPRAAANQFLLARQSWTLAGDHAAKCLGHFAQGLALAEALHYEPAMLQYGRAERLLSQPPRHGPAATRHGELEDKMRPLLLAAQAAARLRLWASDGREPGQSGQGASSAGGEASDAPPRHGPDEAEAAAGGGPSERGQSTPPQTRPDAARPLSDAQISNLPPAPRRRNCPIPGHSLDDGRYAWYTVADRQGDFLSFIQSGIWLLADNDVDTITGPVLVIVGSRQAGLGSISLRPFGQSSLTLSLYLGLRDSGSAAPALSLPHLYLNDRLRAVSGSDVQVLAVVRGLWQLVDGPPPMSSLLNLEQG